MMFYNYNPKDKENRFTMVWLGFLFLTIMYVAFEAPVSFVLKYDVEEHNMWWDALFSIIFFTDIALRLSNKLKLPTNQGWSVDSKNTKALKPYHK